MKEPKRGAAVGVWAHQRPIMKFVNLDSGETTTVSGVELIERGVEFTLPTNSAALLHWRRL
jgi:hypothetical protein